MQKLSELLAQLFCNSDTVRIKSINQMCVYTYISTYVYVHTHIYVKLSYLHS